MEPPKATTLRLPRRDVEAGRIPWRIRLKAWWDGYDVRLPKLSKKPFETDIKGHDITAPGARLPWDDPRISLVQAVWGDGFDRPGSREFVLELIKPVGLDPSMSVAVLDAGLGGATRAISKAFDVWITGFEGESRLAEVGNELSHIAGLAKKAPILHTDVNDPDLKTGGYDCIFAHESFFLVPDKEQMLEVVERALKPSGQLLFTDYVLTDGRASSPALQAMLENEPKTTSMWSVYDYREALSDLQLDIRISEDITPRITGMITRAWHAFMENARKTSELHADGDLVIDEAELWTRRLRALEEGTLRVYRFHALKRNNGRLMSDW